MIRWLRMAAAALGGLATIVLGAVVGLLLVENSGYAPIRVHPWLEPMLAPVLGKRQLEVQVPLLLSGWLVALLAAGALLAGSMYYAWRRRQYESLVARLERDLVKLRNLPLTDPVPLADLPEAPDPDAGRRLVPATGLLPGEVPGQAGGHGEDP